MEGGRRLGSAFRDCLLERLSGVLPFVPYNPELCPARRPDTCHLTAVPRVACHVPRAAGGVRLLARQGALLQRGPGGGPGQQVGVGRVVCVLRHTQQSLLCVYMHVPGGVWTWAWTWTAGGAGGGWCVLRHMHLYVPCVKTYVRGAAVCSDKRFR